MNCTRCQQQFEGDVCPSCKTALTEELGSTNPYALPPPAVPPQQTVPGTPYQNGLDGSQQGDSTGGLIPYKNPKALIAYYLGIVSGLPLIGLPFGIAAFVLGIMGLKARKRTPVIKGSVHAWIGIGCGGLFTLLWSALVIAMIASFFFQR